MTHRERQLWALERRENMLALLFLALLERKK